jgi:RNA polymerase sigma factor (sigma-70 family)
MPSDRSQYYEFSPQNSIRPNNVHLPTSADKSLVDSELDYFKKITIIRPNLLAFCRSVIFDWSEAEDICQNALVILANKEPDYDRGRSFYGWAFCICRFQIKGYIKKEKRSRTKTHLMGEDYFDSSVFDDSMIGESFEKKVDMISYDDGNAEGAALEPSSSPTELQVSRSVASRRGFEFDTHSSKAGSIKHLNNIIPKAFFDIDIDQLLHLLSLNKRELKIFHLLKIGYANQEIGKILKLKTSAMNIAKRRLLLKLSDRLSAIQKFNKYDYQESPI